MASLTRVLGLSATKRTRPRLVIQQQRRQFAQQSFSSYEYPLRTQAPVVTRTTAAEAAAAARPHQLRPPLMAVDHFDDEHTLSDFEVESRRRLQKKFISTQLTGSTEILPTVPDYIPPNVPSELLQAPHTEITRLENGVRVVSQEMYSQVCTIGVLINVGSRHETVTGTCHLLEMLAFQSTIPSHDNALSISQQLQKWGALSFANSGREQTLYCLDILRPNVQQGMQLLTEVVLEQSFQEAQVESCKMAMHYQAMDIMPEMLLGQVLQEAAYGKDQQLGKPHFCPMEALPNLNAQTVRDFCDEHIVNNPKGLVVAGAGMDHAELVDMAKFHFGHLHQDNDESVDLPSKYRGGEGKLQHSTVDGFTRVALVFELGGWHSDDLVPTCVLQTLLGGGNSFSAGGPGKGMYSRLYRQVLNRYFWAESAEAFTAFHNESGLFGISGSSTPNKSGDITRVLAEHFGMLAMDLVSDEELERARNMLKNNVLTQLESRLVLFEDMGRQVLTYGHREEESAMCQKIDAVTKQELRELMRRALQQPPTLAAVGADLSNVPSHADVSRWFK